MAEEPKAKIPNFEFLKPLFNEDLNSEGAVKIVGSTFQRSRILGELEEITYDLAFQDWRELRRQNMLDKANAILEMHDNKHRFNALKDAIKGSGVVPFIGAGLSIPSGYQGWTAFLWEMQGESHVPENDLKALLTAGLYEEAAQLLYDDLGPGLFDKQLRESYARTTTVIGPVNFLPVVFPSTNVITTNFDLVLEGVFKNQDQGFDQILHGNSLPEVIRLFTEGTRLLVKMHGLCNIIADRVLLREEYERAYADAGAVKRFFTKFIFAKSMLFLGCSLTTDRTLKTMVEVVTEEGASTLPAHYAFLELKAGDDRIQRKKDLAQSNIFPIWYPEGEDDESIEALLTALMED